MRNHNWLEGIITAFAVVLMIYSAFVVGGGIGEFNDWFSEADKQEAIYIIAVGVGGIVIGVFLLGFVQLLIDTRTNIGVQRNTQQIIKQFIEDHNASTVNPQTLKEFSKLHKEGVITDEEFEMKKKELM